MGTKYRGSEKEIRALDAFIKLNRATDTMGASLGRHLAEQNLTGSQFGILEVLLHLGPMCQRAIGEKILKTGGNITAVVDNLEKRGLVERVRDAEDRRFVTVHLTDEGRRLITSVFPSHLGRIVEEMSALTPDEQEELGRLCKKLGLAGRSGA